MRPLFQLLCALGLVLVHQLDADGLRDAPHHLVLIDRLGQFGEFRKPLFGGDQQEPGLLHLLGGCRPALGLYPLYQAVRVTLRQFRLCPDVYQHDLNQNTLVHDMRCADDFSAAGVAATGVTAIGGL